MGAPRNLDVRFVNEFRSLGSVRDKELEESARRSHAARASQSRRRQGTLKKHKTPDKSAKASSSNVFRVFHTTTQSKPDDDIYGSELKKREASHSESKTSMCTKQRHMNNYLSITRSGNSDPFRSRAVNVTAYVNKIVKFTRDVAIPAFFGDSFYRQCVLGSTERSTLSERTTMVTSKAAARHWDQVVTTLDNEGTALACLANFLSISSKSAGKSARKSEMNASLAMRTKSSALLREDLRKQNAALEISRSTMWHMFWLFQADVFAGNSEAGRAHSRMIWKLILNGAAKGATDNELLFLLVLTDIDLAVRMLARPLFDTDYFRKHMQRFWDEASGIMPPINFQGITNVHESVNFEPVRECMIDDRLFKSFVHHPLPATIALDRGTGDVLFALLSFRSFDDTARLLHAYHDLLESKAEGSADLTEGEFSMRAAMTLAMLQSFRSTGKEAYIGGIDIREASYRAVWHMQGWIVKTINLSTETELAYYREVRIWMLFLGASYVQKLAASPSPDPGLGRLHFAEILVHECKSAGPTTWPQMRALLEQFTYCEIWVPHGSTWFERMLRESEQT